ncbi:MAG: hypothetical protein EBS87_07520 [Sphingomonadaceae bacterium]|jgi:hypothetical protein|nr:hypothetical protein [Sphingomonadaceae bacterium]NBU77969.1 hypothetical protein [Sphingomonadaceae bacterium]NCA02023.1 hypothetical protein [Sphingomonadaceae bacterium]
MRLFLRYLFLIAAALLSGCDYMEARDIERTVRSHHRDPDATLFRGVTRCAPNSTIWQGEFNAKNAYGAYVGYQSFIYEDGKVTTVSDGEDYEDGSIYTFGDSSDGYLDALTRCTNAYTSQIETRLRSRSTGF